MSVVFLFGNGLSCGFDARLATSALTGRVLARLGPDYVEVLEDLAELASPEDVDRPLTVERGSFETLAGPVDRIADAMRCDPTLAGINRLEGSQWSSRSYRAELRLHYLRIVGSVLAEVDACCTDKEADADRTAAWAKLNAFAAALCTLHLKVPTTFFTLNYDSLLMSALLETEQIIYDGFRYGGLNVPLARWGRTPALYHLHGSVAWVLDEDGAINKPSLKYVRAVEAVDEWALGQPTQGWPSVVLGDLKSRQVARFELPTFLRRVAGPTGQRGACGGRWLQLRRSGGES